VGRTIPTGRGGSNADDLYTLSGFFSYVSASGDLEIWIIRRHDVPTVALVWPYRPFRELPLMYGTFRCRHFGS